jgi:ABC-type dipeptide/oligopeptide/nickel transport system permease subunit
MSSIRSPAERPVKRDDAPLLPWRHAIPGLLPLAVLGLFVVLALGTWMGLWADAWREISGPAWSAPTLDHWFGTNQIGQDVLARSLQSIAAAFEIGLIVAVGAALLGLAVGALAGYYQGRWIDEILLWLTGCFESIPYYLLMGAVLFALAGVTGALQLAMILSFWPAVARTVRIRVVVLRSEGFITAARVSGSHPLRIVRRHIVPHLSDITLVQVTLLFVAAIKTEVVLSFIGLSGSDSISFGRMLAEAAQDLLAGQFQNFAAASILLFALVWSLNRIGDELQNMLDPRRVGLRLRRRLDLI